MKFKGGYILFLSKHDYEPYGSALPYRGFEASKTEDKYKFGYNGQEKESEIGNDDYDFGARIYDGRIGRWISSDPLAYQLSSTSPYCSFNNNPIAFVDDGGEIYRIFYVDKNNTQQHFDFDGTNGGSAPNNPFVNAVIDSYNYIVNNSADYKDIMLNIATSSTVVDVYYRRTSGHSPKGHTIFYNPAQGLTVLENNKRKVKGMSSPAVSFYHESVHDYLQQEKLDYYDEEQKVAKEYEKNAILKLIEKSKNETYRDDYFDYKIKQTYFSNPTSTIEVGKAVGKAAQAVYKFATKIFKGHSKAKYNLNGKVPKQKST